ncbi:hypothetical protein C8R44DRAFT_726152 [Mycena epipterygia]|nr:hypothetical protein C8R44DRAFT_726152 [Mycena epipterygia]
MYKDREAKCWEISEQAMVPSAVSLPLIEGDVEGERSKRKGKAVATEDDDKEELRVVDVPEKGEITTCVIMFDGLDDSITMVMFRAFTCNTFWNAHAEPISIIHGQGQIWVRFADATGGLRVFGSLHSLGYDVRASWASLDDFEEAAHYSHDLWTLETTAEEATVPGTSEASNMMEVDCPVQPPSHLALAVVTPEAPSLSAMDVSSMPPVTPNVGPTTPMTARHLPSPMPLPLACNIDIGTSVFTMRQLQLSHLACWHEPLCRRLANLTPCTRRKNPRPSQESPGEAFLGSTRHHTPAAREEIHKSSGRVIVKVVYNLAPPHAHDGAALLAFATLPCETVLHATTSGGIELASPTTRGHEWVHIHNNSLEFATTSSVQCRPFRAPTTGSPTTVGVLSVSIAASRLDKEVLELREPVATDSPVKKRVRCRRHAGRVIQDAKAQRKAREVQAEALMDVDDDMNFAMTEVEAQEECEEELAVTEQKWSMDDNDDPPIAGG